MEDNDQEDKRWMWELRIAEPLKEQKARKVCYALLKIHEFLADFIADFSAKISYEFCCNFLRNKIIFI